MCSSVFSRFFLPFLPFFFLISMMMSTGDRFWYMGIADNVLIFIGNDSSILAIG